MALRALMLKKSIDTKKNEYAVLREKDAEFSARAAEIEKSIDEVSTEEEQKIVTETITAFEEEKNAHDKECERLSAEIAQLEADLEEMEKASRNNEKKREIRKDELKETMNSINIDIRSLPKNKRAFEALTMEQRRAIVEKPEVQTFFENLRAAAKNQRSITGGELTIPVDFLELISENMYRYSKLMNRVRVRNVTGETRQTIAGVVPEAVWTEMCGAINELTFVFNQVTLDGFKVAGYIPVCNALLEDNDINLASWIVEMLSESIGMAKDKAILYGRGAGNKMPLGIVTRLAQTSKPSDYPANAPAWVDLHTTNIQSVDSTLTGTAFWAALTIAAGNTYTKYSRGEQFWAMNSKTYALLKSKVITLTATGDVVSNIYATLPVITGNIDILEFIPDGDIIGGYGDLYLWAQRSGMTIESSREVQFIQDNTVFRGKERADGMPLIAGAFVALNINGGTVTTDVTFAADNANNAALRELAVGSGSLSPTFDKDVYAYTGTTTASTLAVSATAENPNADIAISFGGKNVRNGGSITPASGENVVTFTVSNGDAVRVYTVTITKS